MNVGMSEGRHDMDDDEGAGDGRLKVWAIGTFVLAIWFFLLWKMFGDVL